MFLTASNLAHYLMEYGLVQPSTIVDGDFSILESGRRNRNFKVFTGTKGGLFVKQPKSMEQQATSTVTREVAFSSRIQSEPAYQMLSAMVPKLLHYDPLRYAQVCELISGAQSAGEFLNSNREATSLVAQSLGNALSKIHHHGKNAATDPHLSTMLPGQVPWVMMLDVSQTGFLNSAGPLGPQLSLWLQQAPMFVAALTSLRSEWRNDALVHGDMKWDNFLVRINGDLCEVFIVDWELVDLGDAAWDIASIFKEYVLIALFHEIGTQQKGTPLNPDWLASVRSQARIFWKSYATESNFSSVQEREFADRSVRFVGPRLVISVLEYLSAAPGDAAMMQPMLETAWQFLSQHRAMSTSLLGYPL